MASEDPSVSYEIISFKRIFYLCCLADVALKKNPKHKNKKTNQPQSSCVHEAHEHTGIHTDHISIALEDINILLYGVFSYFTKRALKGN